MILCLNFLNTYGDGKPTKTKSLVECDDCGTKRLILKGNAIRNVGSKFCRSCCRKGEKQYLFGRHHSKKTRSKMSLSAKGKIFSQETLEKLSLTKLGEKNPMFGTHHTEEFKRKLSESERGEKHPRWRHDLTQEERENNQNRNLNPELREWRKLIFERDNYTCQITGDLSGGNLVAHHIFNWWSHPDKRFDIANGITLRKDIHTLFHNIYGTKHNTPTQFEEFKQYMKEILC